VPAQPYQLKTPWGNLRGQKVTIPAFFFQMTEDEIVEVLVGEGYNPKRARIDAKEFLLYQDNLNVKPKWTTPEVQEDAGAKRPANPLAQALARKKGTSTE
jgi:hypothetical protein